MGDTPDEALDWLEEARTWAQFLALLAKDGGGHLVPTTCVRLAQMLNEAEAPERLRAAQASQGSGG